MPHTYYCLILTKARPIESFEGEKTKLSLSCSRCDILFQSSGIDIILLDPLGIINVYKAKQTQNVH